MKHGHVTPNEDGSKARCGGPGFCKQCNQELGEEFSKGFAVEDGQYKKMLRSFNRVIELNINSLSVLAPNITEHHHGHVFRRPDSTKETCGGPAVCEQCESDLDLLIRMIKEIY